ncbi:MAG: cation transporter [Alphaproteobacteria bacterium]|nr:cation transporter [Alphaproteobacteria bacterium]
MSLPHDHHDHDHDTSASERRMWWVVGISLLTMLMEVGGGMFFGSLALEADGWHMAVHAGVLGIAGLAMIMARRERRAGGSAYSVARMRAMGGFANGIILLVAGAHLGLEALERLQHPGEIHTHGALTLAVLGLLVNLLCVWLLKGCPECHGHAMVEGHHGHPARDHNLRAIYLHLLSDAATSLAAIAGVAAAAWGWTRLDPLMALAMAALILWWAASLLCQVVPQLLDRTAARSRCS